jgi:hypothetical protein
MKIHGPSYKKKHPDTSLVGDWVSSRTGLDGFGEEINLLYLPGIES